MPANPEHRQSFRSHSLIDPAGVFGRFNMRDSPLFRLPSRSFTNTAYSEAILATLVASAPRAAAFRRRAHRGVPALIDVDIRQDYGNPDRISRSAGDAPLGLHVS